MNKKFTRISAIALTGLLGVSALAGCTPEEEKPWGDKIRIDVSIYAGGFGTDWFVDLANEYNASQDKYYINKLPDNKNDIYSISQKIVAGIKEADIFITNSCDFEDLKRQNKLIDLTEVYNTKHADEDTDVKGKVQNYELVQQTLGLDGKMYGLPYQKAMSGIVYDHDLFESMGLLFEDNTTANGLTKGKDGVEGTYDDGLPVTYEDFKDLVDEIKTKQMIPFIISDKIETGLTEPVAEALWAQYDGLTNYEISYSYNGTYTSPSTGVQTPITPDTGYKLYSEGLMEGRVKAATFFEEMVLPSDNNYNDVTNTSGWSHTDAQGKFLMSHNTGKRVAMIFEGNWWENEAKPSFAADANANGSQWGYGKRDFRMMPLPSFDGESAESAGKHYFQGSMGAVFAVKQDNAEREAGIIDFLKAYTKDSTLRNYTKRSGALLPYDYEFSNEEIAGFTPFTKNMIEIQASESTVLVDTQALMITGNRKPLRWDIRINGQSASSLIATMRKGSVSEYAQALKDMYNSTNWATAII